MIGKTFGRLTVISLEYTDKNSHWRCRCSCGKEIVASRPNLRTHTTSCGCYNSELVAKRNYRHGETRTRLYNIWVSMRQRAGVDRYYEHVTVCDEWQEYLAFRNWARANGYRSHLTIDRINGHLGYSPSNCRWVTMLQQRHNRRALEQTAVASPQG